MTPTDTILAWEKALEAGPMPGPWTVYEPMSTPTACPGIDSAELSIILWGDRDMGSNGVRGHSFEEEDANAQWIATTNPLAIRTLLDAHASALRDAARLDWLVSQLSDRDFREFGLNYRCGDDSIRGAIDSKLAALDDNTKGA